MKNFDESIRQRIIKEELHLNPEAEVRFEQAMARARTAQKPKRNRAWIAVLAAACLIGLFFWKPTEDIIRNTVLPTPVPEMIPLMQPTVSVAEKTIRMHNPSDEIWLMEWQTPDDRELIWLEPGAECEWRTDAARAQWKGYRVTSDFLHWMDTDADEAEQQELMADAFTNGAMILAPGEWENGEAGAMNLPLPNGVEGDAVEIYLKSGDLTDGGMKGIFRSVFSESK